MKTESKYIECPFEQATHLQNENGETIQFAKLTPVRLVQVEVLPEWVTDDRKVYFTDTAYRLKYGWFHSPESKRRLFDRGVHVFFTQEEAIAATDAQIAENLAKRDGKVVEFTTVPDALGWLHLEPILKFAGHEVRVTIVSLGEKD